jgi:hypothetical protein
MQYNTSYIPQQYKRQLQKNTVSESCFVTREVQHSNLKRAFSSDRHEYMHISVGTATGYGLDGPVSIPGRGKVSYFSRSVQTVTEAHPASRPIDIGGDFPGYNAAGT